MISRLKFRFCSSIYTVAIIGKPNVGKSTLFNKLNQTYTALVDKHPGMTRDYNAQINRILGFPIKLIDTAGVESLNEKNKNDLSSKMFDQTHKSL